MAAGQAPLPADVRDLSSPSARLVYLTLRGATSALTIREITGRTGVSADRCRRVLGTLVDMSYVDRDEHPDDRRRRLYSLADPPEVTA